jgi:hypothetical protein
VHVFTVISMSMMTGGSGAPHDFMLSA